MVAKQDSLLEAGIVLEMLHGPIHQWREPESRLYGPPWWRKIRDAANENPLQTLALLIDSIDGMAL